MVETSNGLPPQGGQTGQTLGTFSLDSVHVRMLEVLRRDGRISIAALADRVGISRANAYTRFEALRTHGVITSFTAEVDPTRVGLGICALVFVTVRQQMWKQFRAQLALMPEVEYCAITTGQHDAMIQIRAADVTVVHQLVTERLANIPAVKATETVLILDEVLGRSYVLPSDHRPVSARPAPVPDAVPLGKMRFVRADSGRAGMSG
jgi:Lrp/AsnC family transcriptional regulator, leucine-responsive regulatory protein